MIDPVTGNMARRESIESVIGLWALLLLLLILQLNDRETSGIAERVVKRGH